MFIDNHVYSKNFNKTVADLRGGARDARPPRGPKFFHFHAVFDQKNRFARPLWELAPPLGEILDPQLQKFIIKRGLNSFEKKWDDD